MRNTEQTGGEETLGKICYENIFLEYNNALHQISDASLVFVL